MSNKAHVNVTLDPGILDWVDRLRGQCPRSTFINLVLGKFCKKEQTAFDWGAEGKKADTDIQKGRVHKFSDPKKAARWLKS